MHQVKYKSKCCKADVKKEGMPDPMGNGTADKLIITMYYVCVSCSNPCDFYDANVPISLLTEKQILKVAKQSNADQRKLVRKANLVKFKKDVAALVQEAVELERKRLEQDVRAAWKHGDLREGNFNNCIKQIFKS